MTCKACARGKACKHHRFEHRKSATRPNRAAWPRSGGQVVVKACSWCGDPMWQHSEQEKAYCLEQILRAVGFRTVGLV